jgi:hypothetical protein
MTITNITGTRTKLAGDKFTANTLIQNQKAESTATLRLRTVNGNSFELPVNAS